MFLTQKKLNVTLLVALEEQKKREAASKEKYDREQRIEAVIQIAEQKLGKKLNRAEVLRECNSVWAA